MKHPKFKYDDLVNKPFEELKKSLVGYNFPEKRLEQYELVLKRAQDMAIRGELDKGTYEIHPSGIYRPGARHDKKIRMA